MSRITTTQAASLDTGGRAGALPQWAIRIIEGLVIAFFILGLRLKGGAA